MIEEVNWTCKECGHENTSTVYNRKYTVRCKKCMATHVVNFGEPEIKRLLGGFQQA